MYLYILLIVLIVILIIDLLNRKEKILQDRETEEKNKRLKIELEKTEALLQRSKSECHKISLEQAGLESKVSTLKDLEKGMEDKVSALIKQVEQHEKNHKQILSNYELLLNKEIKEKEVEYKEYERQLSTIYQNLIDDINRKIGNKREELSKIQNTRISLIEASKREEEIKQKKDYYRIVISDKDKHDISVLEQVKSSLNNPRILNMLVWSTFYQKPMKELIGRVVGSKAKTGVYKITNIENTRCYIGQAIDIAKRFTDHAKCGLGIDAPSSNKLYKAMQEQGLENFTFEILEECNAIDLNEKERFYIDLYKSYEYGYNGNKGIK